MDATNPQLWPLVGLAFGLGLSHGADPDHLAAIDGMTRVSADRYPLLSRWVGPGFAVGHSLAVLSIAVLIGLAIDHVGGRSDLLRQVGWALSALMLFAIGTINLARQWRETARRTSARATGLINRLNIIHPLWAIPLGLLFGVGMETASQMSAWALAGSVGHGVSGALLIGGAFSLGMVMTDSLNGLVVRRLYLTASRRAQQGRVLMTGTFVGLAYAVGFVKLLQPTPFAVPVSDEGLTVIVFAAVLFAFGAAMVRTRSAIFG